MLGLSKLKGWKAKTKTNLAWIKVCPQIILKVLAAKKEENTICRGADKIKHKMVNQEALSQCSVHTIPLPEFQKHNALHSKPGKTANSQYLVLTAI